MVEKLELCAELLESLVADRGQLAQVPEPLRRRLLEAAGKLSRPERHEHRAVARAFRRLDKRERRDADQAVLDATGIRAARREAVFSTPAPMFPNAPHVGVLPPELGGPSRAREDEPVSEPVGELREARKCYVCKRAYRAVHAFYDGLCTECGDLNFAKRNQSADLRGRVAVVTGARVKIGYHAAIKLLRAGCRVHVTTRFPRDAAARFAREADFDVWRDRVVVHGLDLRHTPAVEAFASRLAATEQRLDFILNNACQTVRRPPGFYGHLMEAERAPLAELPAGARDVLALASGAESVVAPAAHDAPALSQLELVPGDEARGADIFPMGKLDADLQQIDLRTHNSWRLALAEVPTLELLEVQLVNAVAPFVLNAKLKPLMLRVPTRDKHIVNVSAMEGQFYRAWKTDKHPHTNMAKAALNMMTRTSAPDYAADGIHMNSVDTGWITDEDPAHIAERKVAEHGFSPPLDVVDGAARIVDPIFSGMLTGQHAWGQFLKDYAPAPW